MAMLCPHCYTYFTEDVKDICPQCKRPLTGSTNQEGTSESVASERTIAKLSPVEPAAPLERPVRERDDDRDLLLGRVRMLERRIEEMETRYAGSSITSPRFLERAFAVWGHFLVAHIIIVLPLFALVFCIGFMRR